MVIPGLCGTAARTAHVRGAGNQLLGKQISSAQGCYPLVTTNSLLRKMTYLQWIHLLNMVIFHRYVNAYQRVRVELLLLWMGLHFPAQTLACRFSPNPVTKDMMAGMI